MNRCSVLFLKERSGRCQKRTSKANVIPHAKGPQLTRKDPKPIIPMSSEGTQKKDAMLLKAGTIRNANLMTSFTASTDSRPTESNLFTKPHLLTIDSSDGEECDGDDCRRDSLCRMEASIAKTESAERPCAASATSKSNPRSRKRRALRNKDEEENDENKDKRGLLYLSGDNQDPAGLLVLSFPMKLHLMLEVCAMKRKNRDRKRVTFSSTIQTEGDEASPKKQKTGESSLMKEKASAASSLKKEKTVAERTKGQKQGVGGQEKKNDRIVLGWLAGGKAFKIYDEERFVKEIMPTYFLGQQQLSIPQGQCSFKDFERNLKLWGFTDVACVEGPPIRRVHICSHPKFLRDDPSACRRIKYLGMLP